MKHCSTCKLEKPLSEYPFKSKTNGTLMARCRTCCAAKERSYRERNPSRMKNIAASNRERRKRNAIFVWNYLNRTPCACGESDPTVLEFDHRERSTKSGTVSEMVYSAASIQTLEAEIAKCDVRCANCHRRRTAIQFGWYAYVMVSPGGFEPPTR